MKGVFLGLCCSSYVLTSVLNSGIFHSTSPHWNAEALFSCGFWYLQTKTIFMLIIILSAFYCQLSTREEREMSLQVNMHMLKTTTQKYFEVHDFFANGAIALCALVAEFFCFTLWQE